MSLSRSIYGALIACLLVAVSTQPAIARGYRHYLIGDTSKPTPGPVSGGLLLMGGGDRNVDSLKWFIEKAGHGHIVVLRASQSTSIADELYKDVGGIASAETFVFSDRKAAYDPKMLARLTRADGIFIAGGDQSRYVRFWKGTPVAAALDAHVAAGKPLAGTSAGLAMQGEFLYGAMDGGSITSAEALADPLGPANTIETDFVHFPLLKGVITDTHFKERNRLGRLFAFVAKAETMRPKGSSPLLGLGVDESAALAVEPDGTARIFATAPDGGAWLVKGGFPDPVSPGQPLKLARVQVVGVGLSSRLHLPDGRVDNPSFERRYAVADGQWREVPKWSLAIHGGAGVIDRSNMSRERAAEFHAGLRAAMKAGGAILEAGGSSLDAVEATLRILEDDPHFNAGRGAVFTAEGRNELDASIMDGKTLKAGAVAGVTRTKHPVSLARAVMDKSPHVMLARDGADRFSVEQGLEQVEPSWFRTEERWQQLLKWKADRQAALDPTHLFGTVGAVAMDENGHLAAATSTGGMTGKRWGRIGDSPVIGAGTYARDGVCAVSATGSGEYFIRESAARQVCDRVMWNGQTIEAAAKDTINAVGKIGGDGGLIAMGGDGTPTFGLNDLGMYRGRWIAGYPAQTAIFADEDWQN